jgi:queuine tRNA-ribosyltransferase
MLCSVISIAFYQQLMAGLRQAIAEGRLAAFAKRFLDRYQAGRRG